MAQRELDRSLIAQGYREADRDFRVQQAKIGCILVLVCMPLGVALDYFVYPALVRPILLSRLLCDLAVAPLFAVLFYPAGRRHIAAWGIAWALLPAINISWMVAISMGAASPYYAGLILVMIVACQLMPYTFRESVIICSAVIGMYVIACFAHRGREATVATLFNNLYFLSITALICVTSSHSTTRRRMSEFGLRYELDIRNKELAELDRLKSEFFANLSHELRTPLTLIISPVEDVLRQNTDLSPAVRDTLEIARRNALRLLKLISDLLEVVRLEEGRAQLRREPLDFSTFLPAMVESVRHLATGRGLSLLVEGRESPENVSGPLVVEADPGRMEKVVLNILTNAIKFTPPGGSIAVRWWRENGLALTEFTDTGIGIAPEALPRVFDRFHQVDGSSTRTYQGVGIGLALAKELVLEHGGRLTASSVVGKGTTLRMELPAAANPPAPAAAAASTNGDALHRDPPHSPVSAPASRGGDREERAAQPRILPPAPDVNPLAQIYYDANRTIAGDIQHAPEASSPRLEIPAVGSGEHTVMVVDDEPDMRQFLTALLAKEHRVLQAADGTTGLAMIRKHRPDAVLLDLMLPEIDGLDVCTALKNDEQTRGIKIVLLTARSDEKSRISALERGADDFLTKPFSTVEVQSRLGNLLKAAKLERDVRQRNEDLAAALQQLKETEVQLVQSEKINALGKLAAGLMHEINNPLNFTLTAVQLAQELVPPTDEDMTDTLKDIRQGMTRIRDLVADLRAFAYPSRNEQQERLDIRDVIRTALHLIAHELKDVAVAHDLRHFEVLGSKTQLTHVLMNLMVNSATAFRKAPATRAPEIRLSGDADGSRLRLRIWDNGEGISAANLPRIFDPFFTTRDVGKGMGLGLSICHTIIRNHGGAITAASVEGEWTEVRFDVPLAS